MDAPGIYFEYDLRNSLKCVILYSSLDNSCRIDVAFSKVCLFFYEFRTFTDLVEKTDTFLRIGEPNPYEHGFLVGGGSPAPLENCPNYSIL